MIVATEEPMDAGYSNDPGKPFNSTLLMDLLVCKKSKQDNKKIMKFLVTKLCINLVVSYEDGSKTGLGFSWKTKDKNKLASHLEKLAKKIRTGEKL